MPQGALKAVLLVIVLSAACTPTPASQASALPTTLPTPCASVSQAACPTAPPCAAVNVTAATPTPTAEAPQRSVLLISFDGGPAEVIQTLMAEGELPTFAALAQRGLRAEYALSVDPPLTAPAQSSIATGAYPNRTGLVSNTFHTPLDSFYWYRVGFDELLDQAEPVWVAASKAGLKTATLFFVGSSPALASQSADLTIGYGIRDAYSRQQTVTLQTLQAAWSGELPQSFSSPMEGELSVFSFGRVFLYAVDSQDDARAQVDTLILSTDRQIGPEDPQLQRGEWGSLMLSPKLGAGADFLIQQITSSPSPQVTLYHSGVYHNTATPRALLSELNARFGFFPAGADEYALRQGWITPADQLWLIERANRWMAEVTAWLIETYHPDLTYAWLDGFDGAGHAFLLASERQANYSPEAAAADQDLYRRAARSADQALQTMLQAVDLQHSTVFLVSDHGMAPAHTTVYVNRVLEQAGLLVLDRRNYVDVSRSKALAVASGAAAHVYLNLNTEEVDGIVPPEEGAALQEQVIALFQALTDPQTGAPVFARVLPKSALPELHLDHPHSGEIFLQAAPGFTLDDERGVRSIFAPAQIYGQHGYDCTEPAMHAFFIAAGAGISPVGRVIPPVHVVDYAPTIAAILGFPLNDAVDGQPIPAFIGWNSPGSP